MLGFFMELRCFEDLLCRSKFTVITSVQKGQKNEFSHTECVFAFKNKMHGCESEEWCNSRDVIFDVESSLI